MSSKRAIRRRSCKGKIRHAVIQAAHGAIHALRRRDDDRMNVYACRFCGGFHIGHSRRGGQRR